MSDIAAKVKAIIIDKLGVDEKEVTPEASFTNDLGADSLDTVELIMEFEKEFNISNHLILYNILPICNYIMLLYVYPHSIKYTTSLFIMVFPMANYWIMYIFSIIYIRCKSIFISNCYNYIHIFVRSYINSKTKKLG